jgi:hypothetical protein
VAPLADAISVADPPPQIVWLLIGDKIGPGMTVMVTALMPEQEPLLPVKE